MLNFSISWWELALIVIAIAIVVGTIYLVRFLKSLVSTLNNVNGFLTENKRSLDNIIENVDEITKDTSKITDKADNVADELNSTVTVVKTDVLEPLIQALATFVKVFTTSAKRKSKEIEDNNNKSQN